MNTEQEIQLSDDLRHIVGGQSFEGDVDTLVHRGRQRRRRSVATRGVAGVGVLALAAAGAVVVVHAGSGSTGSGTPNVQTAAYVAQRVAAALSKETEYIYKSTDNDGNPADDVTLWTDSATQNTLTVDRAGDSRTEYWSSTVLRDHYVHALTTEVDYRTHTWSVSDQVLGGYVPGALPPEQDGAGDIAGRFKSSLSSGDEQIVGHGEYQGHQVTKLASHDHGQYSEIWVDSQTYLPVHSIFTLSKNDPTIISDIAWLPRSADLVNTVTNPQIPAGFTQVPPSK